MKGKYHVVVQNSRVRFEFDVKRNITIVRGDSATGKTTLMTLVEEHDRLGDESGVDVICERRCLAVSNANWEAVIGASSSSIIFVDEDTRAVKTPEFARLIQQTDNYYVIITRESLPNLPYSVEEVYGIHTSGKYADLRRTYNSFFRLYEPAEPRCDVPVQGAIVEDSNAGYEFFRAIAGDGVSIVSAQGKAKIRSRLLAIGDQGVVVIADGAAFGPEMDEVHLYARTHPNVYVYLPESFEWLILSSGLIDGNRVSDMLAHVEDFVESKEYFSWEQFFTRFLVEETAGTNLHYSKSRLNPVYLGRKAKGAMLGTMGMVPALLGASTEGLAAVALEESENE